MGNFVYLYRKNNKGIPCFWAIRQTELNHIDIKHGIVLGTVINESFMCTMKKITDEVQSRINKKRKEGYKYLYEIKDNVESPVEEGTMTESLYYFLKAYLPDIRTAADNSVLPMLAKAYDNANNKLFKKVGCYIGQWKINGLRCFISAKENIGDMFKPISLIFQSREGNYWNSLVDLEDYLLSVLPKELIFEMINNNFVLDGELYLPGHTVNEINHFVKDPKCKENKFLQYWCYDIAIQETIQSARIELRNKFIGSHIQMFNDINSHLNNKERLVVLPNYMITDEETAITYRNDFIDGGFEGLILRNPDKEYQYGTRNLSMIKFKKSTDGKFVIKDIYPESAKRSNIPIFLLVNDINDATFEVHLGGSMEYQASILQDKEEYIGKMMYVEYGERSGVTKVPFHVKATMLVNG